MVSSLIADNKVTAFAIGSFSFLSILYIYRKTHPSAALPPGPPPLPVVGNTFQMPKEQPWLKYAEWAKQYGKGYLGYLVASQISINIPWRRYYARPGIQSTRDYFEQLRRCSQTHVRSEVFQQAVDRHAE